MRADKIAPRNPPKPQCIRGDRPIAVADLAGMDDHGALTPSIKINRSFVFFGFAESMFLTA